MQVVQMAEKKDAAKRKEGKTAGAGDMDETGRVA